MLHHSESSPAPEPLDLGTLAAVRAELSARVRLWREAFQRYPREIDHSDSRLVRAEVLEALDRWLAARETEASGEHWSLTEGGIAALQEAEAQR